ncbi:MAG TPA: hypothetical protein DIW81_02520 [Planctomycetaceae bacterium]|nr:hypothetical protein [Planctomycetaceae bacterium]
MILLINIGLCHELSDSISVSCNDTPASRAVCHVHAGGPTDFVGWVLKAQDDLPFALHVY